MKIDVVLLTMNSNKPIFRRVLDSLYRNVEVNRLIVVDGGSTDGTIEVLSKYPNVEMHYDLGGTRATAREMGIKLVETEWFLFLDSDVILCKDWQKKAERYIEDDVGAVQGYDIPIRSPEVEDYHYAIVKLRRKLKRHSSLVPCTKRGFTGDALIRTELVKDIKIPAPLHVFEDYFIRRWIERKGYRWVVTKDPYCLHAMGSRWNRLKEDAFFSGYLARKFHFYGIVDELRAAITIFPKVMYALTLRPNFKMAKMQLLRQYYVLAGYLKGCLR
ncbi:MAG: hypothetical protein DRO39_09255 [Thermoprotei archaeon]|nr:MAG: hypothetical protein DRO39_09255 [Thermoprotei archaeon]